MAIYLGLDNVQYQIALKWRDIIDSGKALKNLKNSMVDQRGSIMILGKIAAATEQELRE